MNAGRRHIQWYICMVIAILFATPYYMDTTTNDSTTHPSAESSNSTYECYDIPVVLLSEKGTNTLYSKHEMRQWNMPFALVTLQGTVGRTFTSGGTLLRIGRTCSAPYGIEPYHIYTITEGVHHTLSAKRFYTGYYIYYRCQMRC